MFAQFGLSNGRLASGRKDNIDLQPCPDQITTRLGMGDICTCSLANLILRKIKFDEKEMYFSQR